MAQNIKNGGPAFPFVDHISAEDRSVHEGMALRDFFAAAALTGLLANESVVQQMAKACPDAETANEAFSEWAFKHADAMLAEREKARA